jgi:transcriptional regulator
MGGRLRLTPSPLPPDPSAASSFPRDTRSSGGSFAKQELKMYMPPPFKSDRAKAVAFAQARGFGTICAWDDAKPVAAALPFCLGFAADGTPIVSFHVARGNALARLGDGKSRWLLAVNGADAYVSADWYASPDQVPTWLYQAVHLTGTVSPMSDGELGTHLAALSGKFESWLAPKPPWTVGKVSTGRQEMLKKAIVGLVMTVEDIEGSFKLNQHKSDADHMAVANALAQQGDPGSRQIAGLMHELRVVADEAEQI